ncbi:SDR family NAD(P)-dependent oxidoreductase [Leptospira sp. 96542]|nr:SDR family NAD(P)-dependent oxidoreductase [Leptospira sp. 96542]
MNPKSCLILGATSDIGKEISKQLALLGYDLILTGRNQKVLNSLQTEITQISNKNISSSYFDVCDFPSHIQFIEKISNLPKLVFCCIGYYEDQKNAREDTKELLTTVHTNYSGVVSILNIITNKFELSKNGTVVVLSSVAGIRGRQINYIYGSAKAGLTAYLSGLRNRLYRSNVHITTILLGPVYTKMSAGHTLIPWITLTPENAAKKIIHAGLSKKDSVYIHWVWRYIMFAIQLIPEFIFKRLKAF